MICSMTGYGAASTESPRGTLGVDLRSVNSRYLDVGFRVADELRAFEPMLREMIAARLSRGKVDCRLFLGEDRHQKAPQALNAEAIVRLKSLAQEVKRHFPDAAALRVTDVLRWPGVVAEAAADEELTRALVAQLCAGALDELVAARAREGAKLSRVIAERVAAMRARLREVAPLIPQSIAAYQARLAERLHEALGTSDDERVRTELALFASKVDVDEELTRLRAHLEEVERTLEQGASRGGSAGKRLDFLSQELNREANTLAAKAASQQISDCALELKLLIEQMREQVQNIE
jgi:uncharacterized protein (TIGR00255 family)